VNTDYAEAHREEEWNVNTSSKTNMYCSQKAVRHMSMGGTVHSRPDKSTTVIPAIWERTLRATSSKKRYTRLNQNGYARVDELSGPIHHLHTIIPVASITKGRLVPRESYPVVQEANRPSQGNGRWQEIGRLLTVIQWLAREGDARDRVALSCLLQ